VGVTREKNNDGTESQTERNYSLPRRKTKQSRGRRKEQEMGWQREGGEGGGEETYIGWGSESNNKVVQDEQMRKRTLMRWGQKNSLSR